MVTRDHFGFVSLRKSAPDPLVVMNTSKFEPTFVQHVSVPDAEGEALTRNGQYLLVAGGSGLTVFRVHDLEAGLTGPVWSLTSPGGQFALQVVPSPDGKFAFVAMQDSRNVAVFNLTKALANNPGTSGFVGMIPIERAPDRHGRVPGRPLPVCGEQAGDKT